MPDNGFYKGRIAEYINVKGARGKDVVITRYTTSRRRA
jgi:hypothetical protein